MRVSLFPRMGLVLFCVVLCAFGDFVVRSSFLRAATPCEELLRLVPDSIGFCVVIQDLRSHALAWRSSPFLEQLRRSVLTAKVHNCAQLKKLSQFESKMKEKLGFDWERLRDDLLGDAVVLAYRPGSPGQPQQEQGVILLRARKEQILTELITRINKVQQEEGMLKGLWERRYNGVVYYRRLEYDKRTKRNKPPIFYYVHGPILALSAQEEMLRQVIDGDRMRPGGYGEAVRRLRELGAERALLAVWLNPRAFDAELDAKIANAPGERSTAIKHFARYWRALDSVVASLSLHERDISVSLGFRACVAELPPAARRLFWEAATVSDVWQRLPSSALLAAGSRLDGVALLDALGGFLTPQGRRTLHATLNRSFATLLSHEDFTGSLLPALGPDWGLCLNPPDAGTGMPCLLFALRVNASRTKKNIDGVLLALLDFAARLIILTHNHQHPDSSMKLQTGAIHGQDVRYLSCARGLPAGVQPAYGLLDGYLVLASSLESINRFANAKPQAPADASVPLLRISFKDLRTYLMKNRPSIVQFFIERNKLSRDAARQQVDDLLAGMHLVERAELNQRSAPGQVIFTLTVQATRTLTK
jgi:hypothetical protein